MEPSETITNPQELDRTVDKFTEACNTAFKVLCQTFCLWQTFCSDIEKTTDAAWLTKILSKTATPLGYLQKANGSWSDSSKESLDLLLDAHFPGSQ